jgi:arginase
MPRPIAVIGAPTSAGAFAPGPEEAPAALRAAGLCDKLRQAGAET